MVKGPLHGLPFCVEKVDTAIVQCLEKLGAIAFCKTNSSTTVFGKTLHPLNKNLSIRSSSGGTACLVMTGGSLFGTGNDTTGSIR
jgi:Asp-tRNA(Asn)/Glu-tRNA(Gln) amidotransferase A subunit family amidase